MPRERTRDRITGIIVACLISAFITIIIGGQSIALGVIGKGYLNAAYDVCSRGFNDGSNCLLGAVPDGVKAFEWEGGFYTTALALMQPECPAVPGMPPQLYDGKNCYLGAKPPNGFVWKDKYFYMKYDACSRDLNDGFNCRLGTAPDGVKAFERKGGFYTTALKRDDGSPYCPDIPGVPLQFYDGKDCYLGAKPKNGFVLKNKYFYMKYDACSRGFDDGSNCLLGTAPNGVKAFEWKGGFYTTALMQPECPAVPGMPPQFYDGKNCYLGAKPPNGFVWKDRYFYMKYDACSRGSTNGNNCILDS